jgi:hypothetical protein
VSDETTKVLDLDELFGQAKGVIVRWSGQEYSLTKMNGLTPAQLVELNKLQTDSFKLKKTAEKGTLTENDLTALDGIMDRMLGILCPTFPASSVPFIPKSKVIEFYMDAHPKNAVQAEPKHSTGARHSAG